MYFGFWPFFVLYVLKFEIKRQKVPTLNGIPGSASGSLLGIPRHPSEDGYLPLCVHACDQANVGFLFRYKCPDIVRRTLIGDARISTRSVLLYFVPL